MAFELNPDLFAAGARMRRSVAPDPITAAWLASESATSERILRLQFVEREFPAEWEEELGTLRGDDITTALRRWSALKHFWRVHQEGLYGTDDTTPESASEAARQILRREPVFIRIRGHRVAVTGRSYSAMAEIGAHELRIRALDEDLTRIAALNAQVHALLRRLGPFSRARAPLRRRLHLFAALYGRVYTERELHRMALYAHALTPHGGPAEDIEAEVPVWWREAGPEDDAALLGALVEAGPARYRRLGEAPAGKKGGARLREPLGYASLFAAWEKEVGLRPGQMFDQDLAAILTAMRAGAYDLPEPGRGRE